MESAVPCATEGNSAQKSYSTMNDKEERQYDIKLYEYLADDGDAFGYNMLGYCYYHGFEVKQNYILCVPCFNGCTIICHGVCFLIACPPPSP